MNDFADDIGWKASPKLRLTPFEWKDPANLPQRQFLYGRHIFRKYLSALVAPGGVGKTSLVVADAVAMASGRNLIGADPVRRLRIWLWNGEDPRDELERRIAATCHHYGLTKEDIGDRLFLDSGRDMEIILATQGRGGPEVAKPVEEGLINALRAARVDILIVDPFVSAHRVSENDNMAIDLVAKTFGGIAERADCAVELVHHVRKTNGAEITVEDGRGASALIAAARSVRVLNPMSKDEATNSGVEVERRRFFFRSDIGKANLAPGEKAVWFNLVSVSLNNGPDDGDKVGVVTKWEWPNPLDGVTVATLRAVQAEVARSRWRENIQASDWVGIAVARVLKLDPKDKAARKKISGLMKIWISNGMFAVVTGKDRNGEDRPYVEVGEPATD
jgi:AAA domain